jgi:hypothetical protein
VDNVLFLLELVAQLENLDLDFALAIMFENLLVGLALAVSEKIVVLVVGSSGIARLEMGQVALDIARGTTAAGSRKSDVGRHDDCDDLMWWCGQEEDKKIEAEE